MLYESVFTLCLIPIMVATADGDPHSDLVDALPCRNPHLPKLGNIAARGRRFGASARIRTQFSRVEYEMVASLM